MIINYIMLDYNILNHLFELNLFNYLILFNFEDDQCLT